MRTRTEVLAKAIVRARTIVCGRSPAVADDAVSELKQYGDPWKLNEVFSPHRHEGYCPRD